MSTPTTTEAHQDYYTALAERNLSALWQRSAETTAPEPEPLVQAYRWRRADYYPMLMQAADIVTPGRGAERRVVQFVNPGLPGRAAATHTLTAAVQLLLPGEIAPSHRHTPAAIRFVLEGDGAYTTVQGEQCVMHRHDLILTPNWTWHDHGNPEATPMMWMDGLDVPLVRGLLSGFYEPYPDDRQPVERPDNASLEQYGSDHLRPAAPVRRVTATAPTPYSPLFIYRWTQTRQALDAQADRAATPHDDVYLEYTHPLTHGPVMPTLACYVQLLRPGVRTQPHRHTSSAVYYVAEGEGSSTIGDETFDWQAGDVVALPPWVWHSHANHSTSAPAILFSIADTPLYTALALYREQAGA
jgi:gentisate 1,2-dioxygenase